MLISISRYFFPANQNKLEQNAIKLSRKYLKNPVLAEVYLSKNIFDEEELKRLVARGEINACEFNGILVIEKPNHQNT